MIAPLVVLALLSVVGGWIGLPLQPGGNAFERWLEPVFEGGAGVAQGEHAARAAQALGPLQEWLLVAVSGALVAVAGLALAYRAYLADPELAGRLRERFAGIHRALLNKYWVDELYDRIVVRPVNAVAQWAWRFWDVVIVDGTVNAVGYVLEGTGAVLRLFQTGFVGTYALFLVLGVAALLLHVLRH
jgi:NADH-quinone oxidoreductase subunit L